MSAFNNADATGYNSDVVDMPVPVSEKVLTSRIKDAGAYNDLDEASKTRLLDYYHRTLRYLEYVQSNKAATRAK